MRSMPSRNVYVTGRDVDLWSDVENLAEATGISTSKMLLRLVGEALDARQADTDQLAALRAQLAAVGERLTRIDRLMVEDRDPVARLDARLTDVEQRLERVPTDVVGRSKGVRPAQVLRFLDESPAPLPPDERPW